MIYCVLDRGLALPGLDPAERNKLGISSEKLFKLLLTWKLITRTRSNTLYHYSLDRSTNKERTLRSAWLAGHTDMNVVKN